MADQGEDFTSDRDDFDSQKIDSQFAENNGVEKTVGEQKLKRNKLKQLCTCKKSRTKLLALLEFGPGTSYRGHS